jgi:hypothetical protein
MEVQCHSSQRALAKLREIAHLVEDDYYRGTNRMAILRLHREFMHAIIDTWREVESGLVVADSVQVLRAVRYINGPDLWGLLAEPVMKHPRVLREILLLINLLENVARPHPAA